MKGRFLILSVSVCLAAMAQVNPSLAAGPPRGRPIEFTAPSPTEKTNLNHTARKTDGLKELQHGLIEPLANIKPGGSLDGSPVPFQLPPPRTAPAAKDRAKELLELRKNWGLLDDADLKEQAERELAGDGLRSEEKTAPELLGLSATDEFFYQLLKADPSLTKLDDSREQRADKKQKKEEAAEAEKSQYVTEGLRKSEEEFNQFLGSNPDRGETGLAGGKKSSMGDFFNLGVQEKLSLREEMTRKERLREYKEIYGVSGGGMTPKEMFESVTARPAVSAPAAAFNSALADAPKSAFPAPLITPPSAPASFTATMPASGLPSLAGPSLPAGPALVPKLEFPARVIPKAPVTFEAPRRPF